MSEKNKFSSEKINDSTEKTSDSTEKIGLDAEKIEFTTEKIPEIIPEITRYRGQRGPDKVPRRINPNSLWNLKPYQNIPVEHTTNSKNWIWILIGIAIALAVIFVIWKLYQRKKKNQNKQE